ncbi:hypothetical protein [Bradyrhizobium acaciae]|uniref:hypothetical protein n=1 Tax=Bradyrhizobium acaciae TaxID=2683706 RepID=UPI001E40C599|nr:hypothetical protein [Bradyrhizobium acaciae]MCC8977855.1 hypothetical protein [Bradyrhizobium acaciae]
MQVITAEFESAVSAAARRQPDLILIAPPPIPQVLNVCKRLLENSSTKDIPIFLVSVDFDTIEGRPSLFRAPGSQVGGGEYPEALRPRGRGATMGQDEGQDRLRTRRQQQLLSILDLLHYAEAEIAEMGIETSVALLEAAIADVAQRMRSPEPSQFDG